MSDDEELIDTFSRLMEASIRPSDDSTQRAPVNQYRDADLYPGKAPQAIRVLANSDDVVSPAEELLRFVSSNDVRPAMVEEFREAYQKCVEDNKLLGNYDAADFDNSTICHSLEQLLNKEMLYMHPESILNHSWDKDCAELIADVIQVMEVGHYIVWTVHLHCCNGLRVFTPKQELTDRIEQTVAGSIVHLLNTVFKRDMVVCAHSVLITLDGKRTIDSSGSEWNADDNDDTVMLYSRKTEKTNVSLVDNLEDSGFRSYLQYGEPFYAYSDKPSDRDMMNYFKLLEAWKNNKLMSNLETRENVEQSIRNEFEKFSNMGNEAIVLLGFELLSKFDMLLWAVIDLAHKERLINDYEGVVASFDSLVLENDSRAAVIVGYHICMLLKRDPEVDLPDVMSILPSVMFLRGMTNHGRRVGGEGRWKFLGRTLDVEDRDQLEVNGIQDEIERNYLQCTQPYDQNAERKSTHLGPPGLAHQLIDMKRNA
jgi:hypothetical protein